MNNTAIPREHDPHPDPMVDAVNTPGVGGDVSNAAGGAAAGAIAGTVVAGPVGAVIGAALGAIAGLSSAETIDPQQEDAYWRKHFVNCPYVENGSSFDDYGPAFGYGVNACTQHAGRSFESIETDLAHGWNAARGTSKLDWSRAKCAARDAWDRVSNAGA